MLEKFKHDRGTKSCVGQEEISSEFQPRYRIEESNTTSVAPCHCDSIELLRNRLLIYT